ncbi:MAG TPA: AMIN domain-containing protein [Candidatus Sulfotelmatobacter sp.]|nr:AMIN domain-containing protein [Candidatus Sulfotelmatobacter sp.]
MRKLSRTIASRLPAAALCAAVSVASLPAQVSVRSVKVLGTKSTVEIEVEASDRIVPQTQVLSGPDRLVVDFPNAVPASSARSQSVDRGEVKDVRVGLFQAKPPVTRVVLDLKAAQSYQVFPYGRTVIIKVMGGAGEAAVTAADDQQVQPRRPGLVATNYTTKAEPAAIDAAPKPPLQVSYQNGLLAISANKATLAQVLYAIQQRTGADISIAAGAEQEIVVAEIEPAPAPEVLARLLNGSKFNFLIVSAADDASKLDKVILSTRFDGVFPTPPRGQAPPVQAQNDDIADEEPAFVQNQPSGRPPAPAPPRPQAEQNAGPDESQPQQ